VVIAVIIFIIILALAFLGFFGSGDSDNDGISDYDEKNGYDIIVYYMDGTNKSIHVTSNPNKIDTDDDGLTDLAELFNLTNPSSADTDDDGLTDYEELITYKTLPNYQDQDRDGLKDGLEIKGWDITVRGTTIHVNSNITRPDTDLDFLNDVDEYNAGTNPLSPDTDGDNVWDSTDIDPLWNVKITVDLVNFTLLKEGAKPYFYIIAYDQDIYTPTVSALYNTTISLDEDYDLIEADINDGTGGKMLPIRIYAFDKNSQTNGLDDPLNINGSNNLYKIDYDAACSEQTFTVQGQEGILQIRIMIIRE